MFNQFVSNHLRIIRQVVWLTAVVAAFAPAANAEHQTLKDWDFDTPRRMLAEQYGFEFALGYTLIWQYADHAVDHTHSLTTGSYDIASVWTPIRDTGFGDGSIGFHVEGGHVIDHNRREDLSANVGTALGVNDDLDSEPIALTELWWAWSFDDTLVVTIGKLDPTAYFDANRVANDETMQFMASPLVNNPAVAFADYGLGAIVEAHVTEWMYVSAGVTDAQARATTTGFTSVGEDWFTAAEVGFMVKPCDRPGNYRLMVWHSDNELGDDDAGFALSFDQEIADGVVPFFRYGYNNGDVCDFRYAISGGVGFEGPLGRPEDLLAVGVVYAKPSDSSLDHETLIEAFYRIAVTDWAKISPDVQFVLDPAEGTGSAAVVCGVRLQLIF